MTTNLTTYLPLRRLPPPSLPPPQAAAAAVAPGEGARSDKTLRAPAECELFPPRGGREGGREGERESQSTEKKETRFSFDT